MLSWFHALMPKDERFFDLFARHSEAVLAGAQALRRMMDGGDAVTANCQTVMDRENDADNAPEDRPVSHPSCSYAGQGRERRRPG